MIVNTLYLSLSEIGDTAAQHLDDALRNKIVILILSLSSSRQYVYPSALFHTDTHHTRSLQQSNRRGRNTTSGWCITKQHRNPHSLSLHLDNTYTHLHLFTQTLTTLDLGYNQIGNTGAQNLADALRNNTVILILSLHLDNTYTYLNFFSQTLTTLDLNENYIGNKGAQHLADALQNNTVILILCLHLDNTYTHLHFFTQTLTTLELNNNHIGDKGAQHLADALRNNTVILILSLSLSSSRQYVIISICPFSQRHSPH